MKDGGCLITPPTIHIGSVITRMCACVCGSTLVLLESNIVNGVSDDITRVVGPLFNIIRQRTKNEHYTYVRTWP